MVFRHIASRLPGLALVRAAVSLVILCFVMGKAEAQTKSSATGDGLVIQAEWWNMNMVGGGYCPLRVEVTNITGRPRTLRVAYDSRLSDANMEVSQKLELPPNGKADFVMSVPVVTEYMSGSIRTYERSTELKKLRIFGVTGHLWWGGETVPTVAVVSNSTPDLRSLILATVRVLMSQAQSPGTYTPVVLKPSELPAKWLDYTTLDLILVSVKELDQLSSESREAVIAWTLAGGNLFVYGLGDRPEDSPELKRMLAWDRRMPRNAEWLRPRLEDRNAEYAGNSQNPGVQRVQTPVTKAAPPSFGTVEPPFRVRPFGFGQLAASSSEDPFPGTLEDWGWVIKTLKTSRLLWHERHGVAARSENSDFWNWLIPGVGRAPVGVFQAVIALFAVIIGPINYFVLRRRGQLHLLIASVPALAIVTTLSLLTYATVSDGFALRGRVRSVTMLDQVQGESTSWSRLSYYAGVSPSGGMRFTPNTAVLPMRPPGGIGGSRAVDWTDGQRMPHGWLRSRTLTQFLTVQYRKSDEHLVIATSESGSARVTNRLGADIRLLVLADENGQVFTAKDLARDASERMEARDQAEAHVDLRTILGEQPLVAPAELVNRNYGGAFGPRVRWWPGRSGTQWDNSRCEEILQALQAPGEDKFKSILQPRTYVAVTGLLPLLDLGVSEFQDEGSLFVVVGSY